MGECTIVSVAPYQILEKKPSIIPHEFHLPACKENSRPSILVVTGAKGAVQLPAQEMTFPYFISAEDLAEDIVSNLITAQLEYAADAHPGIFWVSGKHTSEGIVKGFPDKLKEAIDKQHLWFKKLTRLADDDWNKYKQSKFISDIQRHAARAIGVKREWLEVMDTPLLSLQDCPFCSTKIPTNVAICYNCKQIVSQQKYDQLQVKKASVA